MPSRKLDDLDLEFMKTVLKFINDLRIHKITVLITCTYRSNAEQHDLYMQGRTTLGRIVTWADAGQSAHNNMHKGKPASLAVDIVPIVDGAINWETTPEMLDLWEEIGLTAEKLGMIWGGRWTKSLPDRPHFQSPLWRK